MNDREALQAEARALSDELRRLPAAEARGRMIEWYGDVRRRYSAETADWAFTLVEILSQSLGPQATATTPIQVERYVAIGLGAFGLLGLVGVALFVPEPTVFQYFVFRAVLALTGAAFTVCIPGAIGVEISNGIKATGAIAVFCVIYFWSPALLPSSGQETSPPTPQSVIGREP